MLHMGVSVQRVPITTYVDQKVAEELKAIARDHDRSLAGEIRRVLNEHAAGQRPAETGVRDA
jgi:hypothetical protein